MARYFLKRMWFSPEGVRYRPSPLGVEIPDHLVKSLPRSAVPYTQDGVPAAKTVGGEPVTLSELALTVNPPLEPVVALSEGNHRPGQVQGEVRDARQQVGEITPPPVVQVTKAAKK